MRTDFYYRADEIVSVHGWSVFPVDRESKIPCMKGGRNKSSADLSEIEEWGEQFPNANVGVPTGTENGIFVVDFDAPEAKPTLERFGRLTDTLAASSGRGLHMYYQHIGGKVVNRSAKLVNKSSNSWRCDDWINIEGLDIRGDGGSIIAPPSVHSSGRLYKWLDGIEKPSLPPLWLCRMIGEKQEARRQPKFNRENYSAPLEKCLDVVLNARPGNRNASLNTAAYMARAGVRNGTLRQQEVFQTLLNAALSIGLGREEAKNTITSGLSS